ERPQAEGNEEWIFTLNSLTGEVVRIEKSDPASGQRAELSDEEYVAVLGSGEDYSAYAGLQEAYGYDPVAAAYGSVVIEPYSFEAGYYHGMADYETALASAAPSSYSSEDEAR